MPAVAPYGDYTTQQKVADMYNLGWTGVASHDGLGTPSAPYTRDLGTAANVSNAIGYGHLPLWWLSFWTVSGPATGDTWYNAGYNGGKLAADLFKTLPKMPTYVVLDAEGYNGAPGSFQQWKDFTDGWAAGLNTYSLLSGKAAFYCNQSEYQDNSLSSLSMPAFIAVSPILGNTPFVAGTNIKGWCGYYATCPATYYVSTINGWGGSYNTMQMEGSGLPTCGPT